MTLARMQKRGAILAQVLAPALAVPLAALALLARHMPWTSAVRGVLGSWVWLFDTNVNALNFYRESIGLDHVEINLRRMLAWGVIYTLALIPFMVAALGIRAEQGRRKAIWFLVAATAAVFMAALWRHILPSELARPLPLFLAILAVVTIQALAKKRGEPVARGQLTTRLCSSSLGWDCWGKSCSTRASTITASSWRCRPPCWWFWPCSIGSRQPSPGMAAQQAASASWALPCWPAS